MSFTPTDYNAYDFANRRHIGPSPSEMEEMLRVVGVSSLDQLIEETVPASIRQETPLDWAPLAEHELLARMREVAAKNRVMTSLIGQGYYGTVTPPAIQRNILENPAWYTAYTPYQPEIAQGRLEALLNYQTMVADLTGLPVANASLLDEATAAAEAMTMAERASKSKARAFFVDADCHPQTISVIRTRAEPLGIEVIVGHPAQLVPEDVFGALFQYPGTYGLVRDFTRDIAALHEAKALAVVATDLLALCLLKEPGAMGADIAIGSSQRFGVPMGYGGPHAAFMSCKDDLKRSMPGRLVGVSVDARGNKAYRLALQTREQHIRREKATSNVCTAQALLAVMASFYAVFHGPRGLRAIAERVHLNTVRLATALKEAGARVSPEAFFDTITVEGGRGAGRDPRRCASPGHQPAQGGPRPGGDLARRDDRCRRDRARARCLRDPRARPREGGLGLPRAAPARDRLSLASGLPDEPGGIRDDALHAPPFGPRPRAGPGDDPAWLLHDEAECRRRDDAHHLARIRHAASVRAGRSGRGLSRGHRRSGPAALPDHRLRRHVDAAELGRAGRICGASHHPRLSPGAGRRGAHDLPSSRSRRMAPTRPRRRWQG